MKQQHIKTFEHYFGGAFYNKRKKIFQEEAEKELRRAEEIFNEFGLEISDQDISISDNNTFITIVFDGTTYYAEIARQMYGDWEYEIKDRNERTYMHCSDAFTLAKKISQLK